MSAELVDSLISGYASLTLKEKPKKLNNSQRAASNQLLQSIRSNAGIMYQYQLSSAHDKALDAIDLSGIYEGVERRSAEAESKADNKLAYEDFLVLEVLDYFKNRFFKWVNKPECPQCGQDGDNIVNLGAERYPNHLANPQNISIIEKYRCITCNNYDITFPRINNSVALLETRRGRCGEWVNCFLLILQALLGSDQHTRYIWNQEDHVWCEYYSNSLKRWVHLDPCENAFDEPLLYANNWGKHMSWVFGFGLGYAIDLSSKYIPPLKQIDQLLVVPSKSLVKDYLNAVNAVLKSKYYQMIIDTNPRMTQKQCLVKLYHDVILKENVELKQLLGSDKSTPTKTSSTLPKGRQSGSSEWTSLRGEAGNK